MDKKRDSPNRRRDIERAITAWGPLLVALIAAAVGLGTWSCDSSAARARLDYLRREQHYSALVSAIGGFYSPGSTEEKVRFLNERNLCWLYCSDDAIRAVNAFLDSVENGAQSAPAEREAALQALMLTLRRDLISGRPVSSTNLDAAEFRVLKAN